MTIREPARAKRGPARRWRPSLPVKLAAALATAFALGLALALAVAPAFLTSPASEVAAVQLHAAAASAAAALEAGLAQRRREVEFLSAIFPVKDLEPLNFAALRLFLRRAQELSPYYALIGFTDASGRVLVSSNGLAQGADVANRDYFTRGQIGTYVSDAHDASLLAKPMGGADAAPRLIDVATPVTDGARGLGVLSAHVSAEWAQVIATTTAQQAGLKGARLEIRDGSGADIAVVGGGNKEALSKTETVSGIGDGGLARWTVVASAPASKAGHAGARWPWALVGLIGLALSTALGWAMGRQITRSLESQTLAVVRLPGGRIPEMREESTPELNDLSAAIRMAAEELAYFGGERVSEAQPSRFSKNISA
jgi:hypothetical protein